MALNEIITSRRHNSCDNSSFGGSELVLEEHLKSIGLEKFYIKNNFSLILTLGKDYIGNLEILNNWRTK